MFLVNTTVICITLFISLNYVFGEYCSDLQHTDRRNSDGLSQGIYVRKSRGKKFLKKNLEIKTIEKNAKFLKSLEKMSLEIKSCVLDS